MKSKPWHYFLWSKNLSCVRLEAQVLAFRLQPQQASLGAQSEPRTLRSAQGAHWKKSTVEHGQKFLPANLLTKPGQNKDVMMWLRCWQWTYENASEDLFKKTGKMMKQMWADLRCEKTCIFCRAGTMLEQIKFPLSVNVVFTGFWAKMDEFESTLFWSALVFPRRAQQSFFLVFTVFFSMSSFQTC